MTSIPGSQNESVPAINKASSLLCDMVLNFNDISFYFKKKEENKNRFTIFYTISVVTIYTINTF